MSTAGERYKAMITACPTDLSTERAVFLKQTIQRFPKEANLYIFFYSKQDGVCRRLGGSIRLPG